jgi:4-amino-4-deoxy-L-arabinose transferase-like glycosyltransferase
MKTFISENKTRLQPLLLFAISFIVYISGASSSEIYFFDEAKNSECAREMLEQGSLTVPTFNYDLRTDKPPLHYFFMMISYSVFGVNAFAARFFSAIFGALTILITFIHINKFCNRQNALATSLILLASFHLGLQFHLAVPDPYLILFITWSLLSFYSWYINRKKTDILLFYFSIGMGILSKGPVSAVLPIFSAFVFLLINKGITFKTIKELRIIEGLIIVTALTFPWYYLAHIHTDGEWTKGFFLDHNMNRFSGAKEGHGGNFLITIAYVLIGMFPLSVYLFQAFINLKGQKKDSFQIFSLIAASVIILFFCISKTRLPNYTVPAYPFLAFLISAYLTGERSSKSIIIPQIIALIISVIILGGAIYISHYMKEFNEISIQFGVMGFIALGIIISFFMIRKYEPVKFLIPVTAGSLISVILFFTILFPSIMKENPVIRSKSILQDKQNIAYWHKINPAFLFSIKKRIQPLYSEKDINEFITEKPEGVIISTYRHVRLNKLPESALLTLIFESSDIFDPDTTIIMKYGNPSSND